MYVLGFNLTPNRGDCLSVLGIAREVAALSGQALVVPEIDATVSGGTDTVQVELTAGRGLRALRLAPDPRSERRGRSRRSGCANGCDALVCVRSTRSST